MAEDEKVTIEKFNGKDFSWWRTQIEALLCQKDLDAVLEDEKPEKMSQAVWDKMDKKARGVIMLSVSKNVGFNILKVTTAKGMIEALCNMYEKPSAANKVYLIRELVNTRMREGDSVTKHINNLNSILSRLVSVDIKFDDEVQALLLLSSLPDSWSGTVTGVTSSTETGKFTFEKIRDLVLGEDTRRRSSGDSSSSLLSAEGRGRRNERGSRQGRRRSQSKTPKDVECWNCKEKGHFRNQCPGPKEKKQVNTVADDTDEEDDALILSVENSVDSWVMDSGASVHATHCMESMKNLKVGDFGKVRLANNEVLDVTGMGDIDLKTTVGSWTLKNVRVIPSLKRRLISVGQLDNQGHEVKFRNGQWKVVKGNLVIARGKKKGSLYLVEIPSEGVTVPVQKNKVKFTESRGQKKVRFAREEPRAKVKVQVERAWKGSGKSVRGFRGSGSTGRASARVPKRQRVKRTIVPAVKDSPVDFLLKRESGVRDISGSGSLFQWEPVEIQFGSVAVPAMIDGLKLGGSFNVPSG